MLRRACSGAVLCSAWGACAPYRLPCLPRRASPSSQLHPPPPPGPFPASWPSQTSGNTNFEGSLNEGLQRLGLGAPQVSVVDGVFVFWSNRTCERRLGCGVCSGWASGGWAGRPQQRHCSPWPGAAGTFCPHGAPMHPCTRPPAAAYELSTGKPVYNTYLVGRALKDGGIIWAANMSALGGRAAGNKGQPVALTC